MARGYSPAEELMKEVIAQAMIPQFKASEFRKTALNFHRRCGKTVQVVNVQVSCLLGDLDGARPKAEELVAAGAGHEYASQPERWVDRLELAELRPRLGGKVG